MIDRPTPITDDETEAYIQLVENGAFKGIMDAVTIDGLPILRGDLIALGLIDSLSALSASNPRCATMRGRREFCEELCKRLQNNIAAIQAASNEQRGATLIRPPGLVS